MQIERDEVEEVWAKRRKLQRTLVSAKVVQMTVARLLMVIHSILSLLSAGRSDLVMEENQMIWLLTPDCELLVQVFFFIAYLCSSPAVYNI